MQSCTHVAFVEDAVLVYFDQSGFTSYFSTWFNSRLWQGFLCLLFWCVVVVVVVVVFLPLCHKTLFVMKYCNYFCNIKVRPL